MAASSSSGSSFTSSSLGRPPTYGQPYASPSDSTWTPVSGASTISALTSEASAHHASLHPLDLGPPGYQATMYGLPPPPSFLLSRLAPRPARRCCHAKTYMRSSLTRPGLPEPSSKTPRTSAQYISARGRLSAPSSAVCFGSAAIRASSWNTSVSRSPVPPFLPRPRI